MHVAASGSLDEELAGQSVNGVAKELAEEKEVEERLISDEVKEEKVRRRGAGARSKKSDDDMDTDP